MAEQDERPLKVVRKNPCPSCPYRKDCPSGLWAAEEYQKLREYDGDMGEQALAGAHAAFHCHNTPEQLCAGWVATHGPDNLLSLRLYAHRVDPSVWTYTTTVELHNSGRAAYEHGMRDYETPGPEVREAIVKIKRIRPEVGW